MYPEVEEYFKIEAEARKARDDGQAAAHAAYDLAYAANPNRVERDKVRRTYDVEMRVQNELYQHAEGLAWTRLSLAEDKVVNFIGRNCGAYRNDSEPYALVILRMLPASVSEIRRAALDGNWCNVFEQFLSQAIAAGVLEDTRSQEFRALETWVSTNWGHRYAPQIMGMVDGIIAAEAERFVAEKNGAPSPVGEAKQPAEAKGQDRQPDADVAF